MLNPTWLRHAPEASARAFTNKCCKSLIIMNLNNKINNILLIRLGHDELGLNFLFYHSVNNKVMKFRGSAKLEQ
jgi:hypothetical protein